MLKDLIYCMTLNGLLYVAESHELVKAQAVKRKTDAVKKMLKNPQEWTQLLKTGEVADVDIRRLQQRKSPQSPPAAPKRAIAKYTSDEDE
jgi:hypothetical protein